MSRKQQRAALVGRESPGETDGQRFGIEHLSRPRRRRRTPPAADELFAQRLPRPAHQPRPAALVGTPEFFIGNLQ